MASLITLVQYETMDFELSQYVRRDIAFCSGSREMPDGSYFRCYDNFIPYKYAKEVFHHIQDNRRCTYHRYTAWDQITSIFAENANLPHVPIPKSPHSETIHNAMKTCLQNPEYTHIILDSPLFIKYLQEHVIRLDIHLKGLLDDNMLIAILSKLPQLVTLHIHYGSLLSSAILKIIAEMHPQLRHLCIYEYENVTDSAFEEIQLGLVTLCIVSSVYIDEDVYESRLIKMPNLMCASCNVK
ncbi:uncharacterized protein LOC115331314 [Ixodes scapularis]|uniref:uncharacterized protein LOC115331314 n=1 Tax=Ixodes scapularis TaxID=6945 RepID=UPI001C3870C8|nr:uncharacterized protein LOC115331314 [Ixodes scapularis]